MTAAGQGAPKEEEFLSIGGVIALLSPEFPDLTVSKFRFLENEGLVTPERTASGYRRFSVEDRERLRYVLTAQRDRYLPLKVIRQELDALDAAIADVRAGKVQAVPPHLRGSGYTQASDRAKGAVGGAKVEGYVYAHDQPDGVAAQQYLPDDLHAELADRSYYRPTDRGFEARLQERWAWLRGRLRGKG